MPKTAKDIATARQDAQAIFKAGLAAVAPGNALRRFVRVDDDVLQAGEYRYDLAGVRNLYVIGAGKATAPMAAAMESLLGERITAGLINVKYGHTACLNRIQITEAGHPVPDTEGMHGTCEMLKLAREAQATDMVICLISGGGSALMPLAAQGLSLADKQESIRILLACGATIHEINAIRKHTSQIKGGQLARAAFPAPVLTLILSDVVGDDMDVIASGPTVPDMSTFQDCLEICEKYRIARKLPPTVYQRIEQGAAGAVPETPKPGDPIFANTRNLIIGSNIEAVLAAREKAETLGYRTLVLSSMITGETSQVALVHAAIAREILKTGHPLASPACILSGGETTVTLTGSGLGGRNQQFVLDAAMELADCEGVVVLSAGTDGNDGPTDAAGALADGDTLRRARELGLDARGFQCENDAYHFFEKLDDLIKTGPTNTNVMDLRILLTV